MATPPLNALRAFEAVGRRLSVSAAAAELGVTISAVSHQLRELEANLGVSLTTRSGRGIALTPEGRLLLSELSPAFDRIQRVLTQLAGRRSGSRSVSISVLPWFAARWLIPRLGQLADVDPELDVRVSTSLRKVDLLREGFDAAIRYGPGDWPDVSADLLFPAGLTLVAHRRLVDRIGRPFVPDEIEAWRPLFAASAPQDWPQWMALLSAQPPAPRAVYDTRELVLHAVLEGLGVGIVETTILEDLIRSGDLVELRPDVRIIGWGYWLVTPKDVEPTPAFAVFRRWLMALGSS